MKTNKVNKNKQKRFGLIMTGVGVGMVGFSLIFGIPSEGFLIGSIILILAGIILWSIK